MDNERRQVEMQHELELAKLNATNAIAVNVPNSAGNEVGCHRLDLLIKLMPRFDPSDVHLFFT